MSLNSLSLGVELSLLGPSWQRSSEICNHFCILMNPAIIDINIIIENNSAMDYKRHPERTKARLMASLVT